MAYERQLQLINNVTAQMQICADMLDTRDESKATQYGFVPGLDEKELAKSLLTRIKYIKSGIFQVMFTGCFNSGKSTLINALIKRNVLKTGATPETAVITKIFFNTVDEEKVIIYKRDKVDTDGQPATEKMYDLKEFFNEYHIDEKDREKFLRTVNHVDMFLKTNGIAGSMVQFVDSPGTQASTADDKISLRFIEHADAIIFLIHASIPMDQYDKEYVARRFANRQMKNVFFVVNHYNQLNTDEDRQRVKTRVRDELKEVFSDKHGNFNEELFNNRVFYVNAYGSMNTRLGKETNLGFMSIMIPDDTTGVPQFEKVLGEFLTSGDKDKVALSAYRPQMASIFVAAEKAVSERRDALNRGIKENQSIITAYENDKAEIEYEINAIRKAIEDTESAILRDAKDAYDHFLANIDSKWDSYFDDNRIESMQIGFWTLVRAHAMKMLAFWRDPDIRQLECDETTKKATQGFADGIAAFINERTNDLTNELTFNVRKNIAQLMTNLSERQRHLEQLNMPINVDEIIEKIALEKNIPIAGNRNQPKLGQAFVAIFFADPELFSTAGAGNLGTMDFIVQVIKINIVDMILGGILFALLGNIFGLILFVFYKIIKNIIVTSDLTKELVRETKTTILDGYRDNDGNLVCDKSGKPIFTGMRGDNKATFINKVSVTIHGAMRRTSNQIIDGINKALAEVEDNLRNTNDLLANDEKALQRETVRLNKILNAIANSISQISLLTDGSALDRNQIRALAVATQ